VTRLVLPQTGRRLDDFAEIASFLGRYGVSLTRWKASFALKDDDTPQKILEAYAHELRPFMERNGFQTADVINVHPGTPNLAEIRAKFLAEHTHSEDEVRFFVDGEGQFWFHFDDGTVAGLTCVKGDFLSVPKGYRHWFDLAPKYFVKAIRIFTNKEGWVAHYTGDDIAAGYVGRA
jgi:1,2-dihydroxy-3-keto-5-methylthiopentene dioxygenase